MLTIRIIHPQSPHLPLTPPQVKKLETELSEAQAAHSNEVNSNNTQIERLRANINQINAANAEVTRRIERESQKRCVCTCVYVCIRVYLCLFAGNIKQR
jgi:hypothetical protein